MTWDLNVEDMSYDELEVAREAITREIQNFDGSSMPEMVSALLKQRLYLNLEGIESQKRLRVAKERLHKAEEGLDRVRERRRKWGFWD